MRILLDLKRMTELSERYLEEPLYETATTLTELGISILERAERDTAVSAAYFQKIGRSVFHLIYISFFSNRWNSYDVSVLFNIVEEFIFDTNENPNSSAESKDSHFYPSNFVYFIVE